MWPTKAALALCLLSFAVTASAASKRELEERIQQLERRLDSRSLVNLMEQVSSLQRELQELRGEIEVQTYSMERLEKRQRDLYLDIDRRLHQLEAGGAPSPSDAPGATGLVPGPAGGVPSFAAPVPDPGRGPGSAAGGTASAALNPAEERKAYDRALEQLKEGRYPEASAAFQTFLQEYPGSSYADNAQYWLGEVYYVTRDFQSALSEFAKVVDSYPDSSKIADAKLKIGYIQYELKDWKKAKDILAQVVQTYPGTTTARLAQERLDRMKREGR